MKPIEVVDVTGEGRELGFAVGRAFRTAVQRGARDMRNAETEFLQGAAPEFNAKLAAYVKAAGRVFPQYLAEIHGLADGAGVSVRPLLIGNIIEELMDGIDLDDRCSSIAVRVPVPQPHAIVGHNENVPMFVLPTQYVVRARLPSGRRFVAYTFSGLLPAVGMNDAGIAQSCNSL